MTYRERRERKAERLREWAESRDRKAAAARGTADGIMAAIPPGQPILVGHHSQRRHERDLARLDGAMRATVEHTAKADEMRRRADNIDAAAERAIYSDDPDAAERLRERIDELERRRDAMKARNAAFRKTHAATLKPLSPFERDRAMPHPGYELRNLAGNISRQRQRLERMAPSERPSGQDGGTRGVDALSPADATHAPESAISAPAVDEPAQLSLGI